MDDLAAVTDRVETFLEATPAALKRVKDTSVSVATFGRHDLWLADLKELVRAARQLDDVLTQLSMTSAGRRILEELE
jgi:hypothetical protein